MSFNQSPMLGTFGIWILYRPLAAVLMSNEMTVFTIESPMAIRSCGMKYKSNAYLVQYYVLYLRTIWVISQTFTSIILNFSASTVNYSNSHPLSVFTATMLPCSSFDPLAVRRAR